MNRQTNKSRSLSLESLEHRLAPAVYADFGPLPGNPAQPAVDNRFIELESFPIGTGLTGPRQAPSAGTPSIQEIVVTRMQDSVSPMLFRYCATGQHIPRVEFMRGANPGGTQYLQIELENTLISSYSVSGSGAGQDRPMESLSINFTTIKPR